MLSIKNKKSFILIGLIALLAASAVMTYFLLKNNSSNQLESDNSSDYNKVDYSPATPDDKNYNDQVKENLPKTDAPADDQPTQTTARIVIVDASQYDQEFEIRAYAANTLSNEGVCTATLTKEGSAPVSKTSSAIPNVTNMSCATMRIPVSEFTAKGDWKLVLSYESGNTKGTSTPKTVTIK